jgi:hypothetical protein
MHVRAYRPQLAKLMANLMRGVTAQTAGTSTVGQRDHGQVAALGGSAALIATSFTLSCDAGTSSLCGRKDFTMKRPVADKRGYRGIQFGVHRAGENDWRWAYYPTAGRC